MDKITIERETLLPCPMCGSDKGYTLGTGPTHRWWNAEITGG